MSSPRLERFARAVVAINAPQPIGIVDGLQLVMIPIVGGRFEGEWTADIMPGGADWLRSGSDGTTVVDARYAVRTPDGTVIQILNQGSARAVVPGQPMWATPRFTAPAGDHDWLNHGAYVSAISSGTDGASVVVEFFKVV